MRLRVAWLGCLGIAVGTLIGLSAHPAGAQWETVPDFYLPEVTWSVADDRFESLYPAGFRFTARITSSAGPIVRGRVIWSHTPGRQKSALVTVDEATGLLTARWEPGAGLDVVPPWVGITYYWDVGDAAGNTFRSGPQHVEYADHTRSWLRSESDDVIVFSEGMGPDINQMVLDAMRLQRETFRRAWGDVLPYKPRAILFSSREAWQEWRVGLSNAGWIGLTDPNWGGTAQVLSFIGGFEDLAYGTVLHEVAHLYQAEYTLMTPCTWLMEGNATFFEIAQQTDYLAYVRSLARSDQLPNLLDGTGPGTCGASPRRGYNIGYSFWVWLTEHYGLDGHRQLIELLRQGFTRNQAIEMTVGFTVQEVERRWRVWLGASPSAPTLVPTPTINWLPSPTPFVFGE